MSKRSHHSNPGASSYVPGLLGPLLCLTFAVFAWLLLQPRASLHLTQSAWVEGSWHTLWTGHLMHFGLEHFAWDSLMFVVFACLLWQEERWRICLWMLIAAPLISIAVFLIHPHLEEYRGLSALDTMLFVRYTSGSFMQLQGWQRWSFGLLPLMALTAKIIYELIFGSALFVGDLGPGVVPLPSAHLVGALLGLIWILASRRPARRFLCRPAY